MKKFTLILSLLFYIIPHNSYAESFSLESSAFKTNTFIPDEYTCNGIDHSPPLTWHNIPPKTQSLVLIIEDPDAPHGIWTHWIIFNISPTVNQLEAGSPIPSGAVNGKNSWGGLGYRGPCPHSPEAHRYLFKLYAVDTVIQLGEGTSRDLLLNAITGHTLGNAELVGLYQKL
jgi:Raf kinase inhibitor-like YbhB/YbcL family protein